MPDVTEAELAQLRASEKMLKDLLGPNSKTRSRAEALVKEIHPDVRTTNDDLAPAMEAVNKLREEYETDRKTRTEAETDRRFRDAFDRVKKEYEFTDEGMQKVLALMKERTIPDIDAAAALFIRHEPKPQPPSTFAPQSWGFGHKTDDPDLKLLFSDEDAFAERETQKVLQETVRTR